MANDDIDRANDFALKIGTVNGTGSASANSMLMQAIFRMGVPVSGKNVFPSNIQGLPTWYEIRVNKDGHLARTPDFDIMVAMNAQTYQRDIEEVASGGYVIYDSTRSLDEDLLRDDVTFLGIPFASLCVENFKGARVRILMKNIAYVGALAALLELDVDLIREMLGEKFAAKPKLIDSNMKAISLGYDYARENFECPLPVRMAPMDATSDSVILTGNAAAALGCVYAGATVGAWYPITPATSIMDAFKEFCGRFRKDPETGKNRFCVVQAEDELAAIGMVLGASWCGARAFTNTSGPGLSLMSEFLGLAYYAEVPAVVFDVQRTGPSTGMPTRTQQGDLFTVVYASHGDTKHIALFPADPEECFYFSVSAFDLAEHFQTPVFVVSDLDIGMNDWMVPRLKWDEGYTPDRGKVLTEEDLESVEEFHRYEDVDGDAIPYRTLPGVHPKGAYFTRGSGHDRYGRYTEDAEAYTDVVDRIARKIDGASAAVPEPEVRLAVDARFGLVTIGACRGAVLEALELLEADGIEISYMRVRGFPFPSGVGQFIDDHELTFVVEQNRDGQLLKLLTVEAGASKDKMTSVKYYGGFSLSAHHVVHGITETLEKAGRRPAGKA
ncbi:MAG: 2-oxoacid:acceptor oxidoreductase subunit alpha [Gemmatimonadota bacterium]|nr:MAG: 2-oxoacid:acceptor oxidoreductase subunit alpha [Gemmatimonadota bacterium]